MAHGCVLRGIKRFLLFFNYNEGDKMWKYEIRKLTNDFYDNYSNAIYSELLMKIGRSYDVVIFELDVLKDCFIAVPFRTEMNHKNGYHFKFSHRSKSHQSGLDYSKIAVIHKHNSHFIGLPSTVDSDEYIEFQKNEDKIHKNIEKYILGYMNHINGTQPLHLKQFERRYKFSTLQYFHCELGIE